MKALFGVLALVIVLAVVASIVRKELSATGFVARSTSAASQAGALGGATGGDPSAAAATALDPGTGTARQKSATLQEQARDRTTQALQQGAERNRRAEP
jgi:hypothetical protein